MSVSICYITASSREEALQIGRQLVEERLAGCVNVIDGMTSIYRWQGKMEEAQEAVLIAKTRPELVAQLTARVRTLHSYTVPCVLELPVAGGSAGYLNWIESETTPES